MMYDKEIAAEKYDSVCEGRVNVESWGGWNEDEEEEEVKNPEVGVEIEESRLNKSREPEEFLCQFSFPRRRATAIMHAIVTTNELDKIVTNGTDTIVFFFEEKHNKHLNLSILFVYFCFWPNHFGFAKFFLSET